MAPFHENVNLKYKILDHKKHYNVTHSKYSSYFIASRINHLNLLLESTHVKCKVYIAAKLIYRTPVQGDKPETRNHGLPLHICEKMLYLY